MGAWSGVGGRVRRDEVDGFLLDSGFQFLFTAYPEAKLCLDYSRLDLSPFFPGILSWYAGRMNKFLDPWRMPGARKEAFQSEFGTLAEKLRIAGLRSCLRRTSVEEIFRRPERSAKEALTAEDFSNEMI